MKGGFIIVIYVDVLFIINFFITFLLLEVTAKLTKKEAKTGRLVLSSAFGGLYALIILADIPAYLSVLSRLAAAVLLLLLAFRFYRVKSFALALVVFLFVNFIFLGIIVGIYLLFHSEKIAVNNGTVYFDIGARGLLLCAFLAYVLSCVIVRLYNRRVAAGEVYTLCVESGGQSVTLFALADTGNRLREPFSGAPVIVAQEQSVQALFDEQRQRLIPASTVSSTAYLRAFKPDKVTVKTAKGSEVIENVYIALSEQLQDGCSAVINPEILCV